MPAAKQIPGNVAADPDAELEVVADHLRRCALVGRRDGLESQIVLRKRGAISRPGFAFLRETLSVISAAAQGIALGHILPSEGQLAESVYPFSEKHALGLDLGDPARSKN